MPVSVHNSNSSSVPFLSHAFSGHREARRHIVLHARKEHPPTFLPFHVLSLSVLLTQQNHFFVSGFHVLPPVPITGRTFLASQQPPPTFSNRQPSSYISQKHQTRSLCQHGSCIVPATPNQFFFVQQLQQQQQFCPQYPVLFPLPPTQN